MAHLKKAQEIIGVLFFLSGVVVLLVALAVPFIVLWVVGAVLLLFGLALGGKKAPSTYSLS